MDSSTSANDPNLALWYGNEVQLVHPTWTTDQVAAEVTSKIGIDTVYIQSHYGKTHGDNSIATSRGKEVEITYNPTPFWTLKSTITQAKPFNGSMSQELQDYIDARLLVWTTIKGPSTGNTWWTTIINNTTPQAFYIGNVLGPIKPRQAAHAGSRMAL